MKQFDVNIRTVYGMRALGRGHSAVGKVRGYLYMPKPMTHNKYDGKILYTEIMSRHCKSCDLMETLKTSDQKEYEVWYAVHNCALNYQGFASIMESVGATNIFERSVEKYGIRYTSFLGNGNSKSFKSIENVYGEPKVIKQECIDHYQKRVGNRLRKLRKAEKLGRANHLTNKKIDTLQNYFGIALRQNTGDLQEMSDAIMTSLYHVFGYHADCPKTSDS